MSEERMEFKTELKQMMDIIIHSLYSHKEIFLRELISNASDAIGKIRFDSLTDTSLTEGDDDFKIKIIPDKEANTITISDNGCGMNKETIIENLGTIARSGTKAFIEQMKQAKQAQQNGSVDLIGQFGVGFYSSFMVAEKVEVISKPAKGEQGVRWISSGEESFTVEDVEKDSRGTDIILHIREECKEYLEGWQLRSIIKKFSDFVEYPVVLFTTLEKEEDGEKKIETNEEVINSQQAIWLRARNEIKDEEYAEFYKHISHDFNDPLKTIHYSAEGSQEFKALLFIPKQKPMDFFMRDGKRGVQLYVNRVFITDECDKILPPYLEFIKGVVDSSDLPLNVSREMLQEDRQLLKIRKAVLSKVFAELTTMHEKEYENYLKFWKEFGPILKSGITTDYENKDKLADLLLFQSTRTEKPEESDNSDYITLAQYIEAMPEEQEEIYYMIAESRAMVENSPYMEQFKAKGYEVLVMTDPVDEILMQALPEYKGKKFKAIDRGELEVEKETETEKEQKEKENKDLVSFFKETLGDDVKEVRLSNRLKESPACVVGLEGQYGAQMERLMKEMGADTIKREAVLELNPEHEAIKTMRSKIEANPKDAVLAEYARLIFDGAMIAAGEKIKDPGAMLKRFASLIN